MMYEARGNYFGELLGDYECMGMHPNFYESLILISNFSPNQRNLTYEGKSTFGRESCLLIEQKKN